MVKSRLNPLRIEIMPELCRFLGIIIRMYAGDHNPPHFQVYYGDFEAIFTIEPLEMKKGKLPPRVQGLVIEWAMSHLAELKENWKILQKGQKFNKIDPLV